MNHIENACNTFADSPKVQKVKQGLRVLSNNYQDWLKMSGNMLVYLHIPNLRFDNMNYGLKI